MGPPLLKVSLYLNGETSTSGLAMSIAGRRLSVESVTASDGHAASGRSHDGGGAGAAADVGPGDDGVHARLLRAERPPPPTGVGGGTSATGVGLRPLLFSTGAVQLTQLGSPAGQTVTLTRVPGGGGGGGGGGGDDVVEAAAGGDSHFVTLSTAAPQTGRMQAGDGCLAESPQGVESMTMQQLMLAARGGRRSASVDELRGFSRKGLR